MVIRQLGYEQGAVMVIGDMRKLSALVAKARILKNIRDQTMARKEKLPSWSRVGVRFPRGALY